MPEETSTNAAAAATEHREEASRLPAEKQLIFSVVDAFLHKMTFYDEQVEALLVDTLNGEARLTEGILLNFQEIFNDIFFYYPNGLKDRSVWEARDTSRFIAHWYEYDAMRK